MSKNAEANALSEDEIRDIETEKFQTLGSGGKPVEEEEQGDDAPEEEEKEVEKEEKPAKDAGGDGEAEEEEAPEKPKEGEKEGDQLPDWMKKRIERANRKEAEAQERSERLAKEVDELKRQVAELTNPDKGKDPAQPKVEKKVEEPKLDLPVGMSQEEYGRVESEVVGSLSPKTISSLRELKVLPTGILAAMHEIADGEAATIEQVGRFIVENQEIYEQALTLPERRWSATLERAFNEYQGRDHLKEKRKKVEQPEVIGRGKGMALPHIGGDDFREYEKRRNSEEREGY